MKIELISNVEKVNQIRNQLKKKNYSCPCDDLITKGIKKCEECIYIYNDKE